MPVWKMRLKYILECKSGIVHIVTHITSEACTQLTARSHGYSHFIFRHVLIIFTNLLIAAYIQTYM